MKMKSKFPNHYDIIPDSFLVPKDSSLLISDYENHRKETLYICKPVASS